MGETGRYGGQAELGFIVKTLIIKENIYGDFSFFWRKDCKAGSTHTILTD